MSLIQFNVSSTPALDASSYINPSFAGFGIEPSNLFSFTGMEEPNELTFNLIDNLVNYTGRPPHLRLGGNTEDYMVFRDDQALWTWINNPHPVGQGNWASDSMLIGPRFFDAANRFPKGTPVTWGLNLAYQEPDWQAQITTMAQHVLDHTPNLRLASFEVGNEPDLYLQNTFRSGHWDGQVYTEQWLERVAAVYEQVLKPRNMTAAFFEPACTASTIGTNFEIKDLINFGIESNGSYIASWNQHDYYYYIGVSTYPLTLSHFMQLSTTEDQFSAWVTQIQQSRNTKYPYALREMGVVGPIGFAGITDVFGAALWSLNFLLYTASLNVTTVQFHMTDNSNASAWQPIEMYGRKPFVRPGYYAYAAFDQIIGPTCTAQVAPQPIAAYPAGYDGYVRAYAVYQAGDWASLVVINSKPSNSSVKNPNSIKLQVGLPANLGGKEVYLSYLTNTGADSTEGTTWNGLSYEGNGVPTQSDDGMSGKSVKIGSDGTLEFEVRDSQAVVANLGARVGSGLVADEKACASFGGNELTSGVGSGSSSGSSGGGGGGGNNTDGDGGGKENRGSYRGVPCGWNIVLLALVIPAGWMVFW